MANWIDHEIPQGIKERIIEKRLGHEQAPGVSPLRTSKTYMIRYEIVYEVDFLFAFLSVVAMHLVCKSFGFPSYVSMLAPVVFILLFPYFLNWGGYYYDYSELAFFALALWAAREYDWGWLLPLTALATWNKESFLFFIPTLYPILRAKYSRIQSLLGTGAMAVVSAVIYLSLRMRYLNNPGGTVEVHWREQLDMLLHLYRIIVRIDGIYGVYTLSSFSLFPLAMIAWTIWRGWPSFTQEFRLHAKIAALINFPLFFLFCSIYETRDLSMLYMVFLLGIAINIHKFFTGQKAASDR
jgi:hypothetical protein